MAEKRSAIPSLSELTNRTFERGSPLRVCVVSSEFIGPVKNGGIGTATSGLLEALGADGHEVVLLYTQVWNNVPLCTVRSWEYWVQRMRSDGIELRHIPHPGNYADWRHKSWLVLNYLASETFDLVYFNEHHGSGYYSIAAKRAGVAPHFQRIYCVITHGSIEWVLNTNDQYIERDSDLEMIGLERRSVEWADVVIGPSTYLLREYESYGWELPRHTYCQPYPLLRAPIIVETAPKKIDEIVFFGRLEARKGLWLFCEALDCLADRLKGMTVSFMGRMTDVANYPSGMYVVARSAKWPFRIRLLTRFDPQEAMDYLKGSNKLAVMPSLADNSPCVVYECMENGIPFLTTRGSGADELVHPDCWPDVMAEPTVESLARRLAQILDHGASAARPRFDPATNLETWSRWHWWLSTNRDKFVGASAPISKPAASGPTEPLMLFVSIDTGVCSLSELLNNAIEHIQKYGAHWGFLLLTFRKSPLKELIAEQLAAYALSVGSDIMVMDTAQIDEAREIIANSEIVLFSGAEHRVFVPFVASTLRLLMTQQGVAVSCAVGSQVDGSEIRIGELPFGDIPAAAGLSQPIAGAIWAFSVPDLRDELNKLELTYSEYGELVTSADLGQKLIHSCIAANKPYHLLPMVGGVRTNESAEQRSHWYRNLAQIARDLGIAQIVHPTSAAWFAMLQAESDKSRPKRDLMPDPLLLPEPHPLRELATGTGETATLEELAAAIGRPDTASEIAIAGGAEIDKIQQILNISKNTILLRPKVDVLSLVHKLLSSAAREMETHLAETTELPKRVMSFGLYGLNTEIGSLDNEVILTSLSDAARARLIVTDIPLLGHTKLDAHLTALSDVNSMVTLSVVEQETGNTLAQQLLTPATDELQFELRLRNVHRRCCVVLELTGSARITALHLT